jgi:nucleotidyltransferase/DNA polymerase involved in DNA repair
MFHILEQYSPTLVPVSIDEGFLDFTTMDEYVWRNTTPAEYIKGIGDCKRRLKSAAGVMCVTRRFKSAASSLTMKHVSQYERLD